MKELDKKLKVNSKQKLESKADITPRSIAVVTTTLYPTWYKGSVRKHSADNSNYKIHDKVRGDLALKMIKIALQKCFHVVVVDGGSSAEFKKSLAQTGARISKKEVKRMSPSRQQGFKEASQIKGVKVICWVEPEKVYIPQNCLPWAVIPILKGETDIIIPKRDGEAFKSYPTYQAKIEKKANKAWNGLLRKYNILNPSIPDLDIWFGPKFFRNNPKLVEIFLRQYEFDSSRLKKVSKKGFFVQLDLWPNAIIFPIISALKSGYKVTSVDVYYKHPDKQTSIEENSAVMKRKRDMQYKEILLATKLFIQLITKSNKTTGIKLIKVK